MDNINNLKVLQLKELCREMQISTYGTKNELKLRIKKHLKKKNEMNSAEPKSPNPSPTILQITSNDKNSENISVISDRKTQNGNSRILITKTNNNNLKRKRESIDEINQNRKDEITHNNSEEESLDDNTHIEMRELAHYDSINQNSEMEEPKAKKQRGNGLIYLPMMDQNNEIIDYKEYSVAEDLILKENNWLKGN